MRVFCTRNLCVNACRVLCPCVSWLSVKSCDSAGGNNPAMQENTYLLTCNLYMSSSFNKLMFLINTLVWYKGGGGGQGGLLTAFHISRGKINKIHVLRGIKCFHLSYLK